MTDDPTQPIDPTGDPTVPVEAVGGDSGPPTEAMPVGPVRDEPPPGNGLRIGIIVVLLLLIAALAYVLLSGDDDDDEPVDTTTTSVSDTTTTAADSTTTSEATTTTEPTTTTTAGATAPTIDSLTASEIACPDPLTLTWTTTNAVSVEVAIDDPDGEFDSGPPDGSMEVPAPCGDDSQTYYVTAIGSSGERSTEALSRP